VVLAAACLIFSLLNGRTMYNTLTGNMILRNKPDIVWDKSGSGNHLKPNNCKTSKPGRLCNG